MSDELSRPPDEHLTLLFQLVQRIACARGLSPSDAEDFEQTVQVKLLETGYAIFERFEGQSSLRTYLTVVVTRLLKDWQNQMWGKWRPSAVAVRLGEYAVRLERLVARDGFTPHEAVEVLRTAAGAPGAAELMALSGRLPARQRRRMVSDELLGEYAGPHADDPIELRQQRRVNDRIRRALREALAQLPEDDRRLIEARYRREMKVAAVARLRGDDAKALYRRCDRLLKTLRAMLLSAGVTGSVRIQTGEDTLHSLHKRIFEEAR
jgi:RNA polymerase sigma factor (sigma-70 family)